MHFTYIKKDIGSFFIRLTAILLITVMLAGAFSVRAHAEGEPEIGCSAAIAVELGNGSVLFEKDADKKIFPASTTKIITALIILENRSMGETVAVGPEIREGGITGNSSLMGLEKGDVLTVRDLLYGMLMVSGNDAAATLAVSTAGSIEDFAVLMNEKAQEIGMTNTHFVTPHGIHNEDHYTTARDMAALTVEAMKNEQFRQIVSTTEYTVTKKNANGEEVKTELRNTNNLMHRLTTDGNANPYYYPGVTGIKTGYTIYAHGCLIASAQNGNRHVAVLLFGDATEGTNARWGYATKLFDYCFNNYTLHDLHSILEKLDIKLELRHATSKDSGGGVLDCEFMSGGLSTFLLPSDYDVDSALRVDTEFVEGICAPVYSGDVVGRANVYLGEWLVYSGNLYATRDVYDEGYEKSFLEDGPMSVISQIDISGIDLSYDAHEYKMMLLWLLIPAVIIIYLLIRIFTVKRSLYKKHMKSSRYRTQRR